jgi:ribosome maturation factor RimP
MTLRERIADWISGGELTRKDRVLKTADKWRANWGTLAHNEAQLHQQAQARINTALAEIDRQKSPNATVRRIGKMLRGEQ